MLSSHDRVVGTFFLPSTCMLVCPQGEDHPGFPAGRDNGTHVLQFQATDSLLSCPEHSALVPTGWDRSHNHCHESASQPLLYSRPPPLQDPWVTDGFLLCNIQPPFSAHIISLSLSLRLSHTPSYVCAVSMVTRGITMALVAEHAASCCCSGFTVPVHAQRAGSQQNAAKGLNGLSSNPLSLSEIIPFSPDNISLYRLTLHQQFKVKILLFQFPVACENINLAWHEISCYNQGHNPSLQHTLY